MIALGTGCCSVPQAAPCREHSKLGSIREIYSLSGCTSSISASTTVFAESVVRPRGLLLGFDDSTVPRRHILRPQVVWFNDVRCSTQQSGLILYGTSSTPSGYCKYCSRVVYATGFAGSSCVKVEQVSDNLLLVYGI